MNRLSAPAIAYSLAAMLSGAGLALIAVPAPARTVPPFAQSDGAPGPMPAPAAEAATRYAELFDLAALPEPIAPPSAEAAAPPPDPAEALRRYRYLGGASAGERNAALFESGGVVASLKLGETLAGFTLVSFDAEAAAFRQGEAEAALPLVRP